MPNRRKTKTYGEIKSSNLQGSQFIIQIQLSSGMKDKILHNLHFKKEDKNTPHVLNKWLFE